MKCLSCDEILSDREDARVYTASGERIGLCDPCFSEVEDQIDYIGDYPRILRPENEDIEYEPIS